MSRIETDKTILPHLPISTEERAGNLIRECVAHGTTHLRTHVDIDLDSGLAKLEGGRWLLMNASQASGCCSFFSECELRHTSRPTL
jgi:cytosine/adenosine deaminase-related metal-dependent hydrolase